MMEELDALGFGLWAEHFHHLINQLRQFDMVAVDIQAAGLDLGNVQQTFDQVVEVVAAALDDLQGVAVFKNNGLVAVE